MAGGQRSPTLVLVSPGKRDDSEQVIQLFEWSVLKQENRYNMQDYGPPGPGLKTSDPGGTCSSWIKVASHWEDPSGQIQPSGGI